MGGDVEITVRPTGKRSKVKIPTLTSQNQSDDGNGLFPRR